MAGEVWSFIETSPAGLQKTAAKMATEAARLGRVLRLEACGVLLAHEGMAFAEELAECGLSKLYVIRADSPAAWTPHGCAQAMVEVLSRHRPQMLAFAANGLGSEVAARVAARMGAGLIANCVDFALEGEDMVARKAVYGGKAHMMMTWSAPPPYLATVDPEALEVVKERAAQPLEIIEESARPGPPDTELVRTWQIPPQGLDLTEASVVLSVGRPIIARADELDKLRAAAERFGAAFGVSRPVVDSGLMPKERQIGASGKWLSADVYIACGVSGSSYHMMGVRQVRHLIAVNTDPNAPILKQAELGIVADLFEVIPALERLRAAQPDADGDRPATGSATPAK